jgi:hypothetical protein
MPEPDAANADPAYQEVYDAARDLVKAWEQRFGAFERERFKRLSAALDKTPPTLRSAIQGAPR